MNLKCTRAKLKQNLICTAVVPDRRLVVVVILESQGRSTCTYHFRTPHSFPTLTNSNISQVRPDELGHPYFSHCHQVIIHKKHCDPAPQFCSPSTCQSVPAPPPRSNTTAWASTFRRRWSRRYSNCTVWSGTVWSE